MSYWNEFDQTGGQERWSKWNKQRHDTGFAGWLASVRKAIRGLLG